MFCRDCDYPLAEVDSDRCPECGRAFDPADPATFGAAPGQPGRWCRRFVGLSGVLGIGLPALAAIRSQTPFLVVVITMMPGLLGVAAVAAGWHLQRSQPAPRSSRWLIAAAVGVPLAWILVVVSLAIHMKVALGGLPTTIGMRGFPPLLVTHAEIALGLWSILLIFNLVVWPVLVIGCAAIPVARRLVLPLGLFAVAHAACVGILFLLPTPFVSWWLD